MHKRIKRFFVILVAFFATLVPLSTSMFAYAPDRVDVCYPEPGLPYRLVMYEWVYINTTVYPKFGLGKIDYCGVYKKSYPVSPGGSLDGIKPTPIDEI